MPCLRQTLLLILTAHFSISYWCIVSFTPMCTFPYSRWPPPQRYLWPYSAICRPRQRGLIAAHGRFIPQWGWCGARLGQKRGGLLRRLPGESWHRRAKSQTGRLLWRRIHLMCGSNNTHNNDNLYLVFAAHDHRFSVIGVSCSSYLCTFRIQYIYYHTPRSGVPRPCSTWASCTSSASAYRKISSLQGSSTTWPSTRR